MANDTTTWLSFAIQQMAAESYLDGINLQDPSAVISRLLDGNNNSQVIPVDEFIGKTRFVDLQEASNADQITGSAQAFIARYQIVDHHADDASGFSATLLFDRETNSYTLSFRSLEFQDRVDGGDWERDGRNASGLTSAASGEIAFSGFAFAQLM
jgi:hypothetical protein